MSRDPTQREVAKVFTITDEDRKLREEGRSWRAKCQFGLTQDIDRFPPGVYLPGWKEGDIQNREDEILASSLGSILQDRVGRLRHKFRKDEHYPLYAVAVTVSQQAIEAAMANTRMRVMNARNVRKLLYRYISQDFEVINLQVDYTGNGHDLTKPGGRYTYFVLRIPA